MSANSFGEIFRVTTFGESHGPGIGAVIEGCPAGLKLDLSQVQAELDRRRPGQSKISSNRKESDEFQVLSGLLDNKTLGSPISIWIPNRDARPADYKSLRKVFRPSHADLTYQLKYGIRDVRGGGRASARETAARVAAGAIAKQLIKRSGVKIQGYVSQIGDIILDKPYQKMQLGRAERNIVRCPDNKTAEAMIALIEKVRKKGDSLGGVVSCVIRGCPVGLGEPVFDKLEAELAKAMMSIQASKGFELGSGFAAAAMLGSQHNDPIRKQGNRIITETNNSGGIQGGISNGMDIYFNVAFKPVSTIKKAQNTIDLSGKRVSLKVKGRHDPCVVPRAVPIVESMAAMVLADHLLRNENSKI